MKWVVFIWRSFLIFRFRSWAPSAPESAIRADSGTRRALSGHGQVVLGDKRLTVRIKHVSHWNDTRGVGLFRAVTHALQFIDFMQDFVATIFRLDEKTEGVFDVFGSVKDGASILEQGFGIGAARFLHFRPDTSEIEESPAQTSYADRLKSLLLEEVCGRDRLRSDDP